ncbi:MAG: hypothetical protein ACE5EC_10155 [Phycisphaerae bacterium]
MLDPVGSTSWHNRHLECFHRLRDLLESNGISDPAVMIVGPGGVTRMASPLLNDAAAGHASHLRKRIGDLARYGDQALRRLPGLPLRSLEPVELNRVLKTPKRLIVIDRSKRVLDAVQRDLPDAIRHCVDISFQPIREQADVVVAFNIVCRLEEKAAIGMAHIAEAVRPGGWLLIDDRSAEAHLANHAHFRRVAPKIHRRDP